MAGVYIHIPFCKSRCRYCDFFSTTMLHLRQAYTEAVKDEILLRRGYLDGQTIESIYFGGGTPSLLETKQIRSLLDTLKENYDIASSAEITMEANPADLDTDKLKALRDIGVNRLSIGIQSFNDRHLALLGRRHNAAEAEEAVANAKNAGFSNVSIDLIYGIPHQTLDDLESDINKALSLDVQHISTYNLTFENSTPLTMMLQKGIISEQSDEQLNQMSQLIYNKLNIAGFTRYEVSNHCKPDLHSHHNTAYWFHVPYIGLGAGAHSFCSWSRQWNISDINAYIEGVRARNLQYKSETLSDTDIYNERVMLRLRTMEGIDLGIFNPKDKLYCLGKAQQFLQTGKMLLEDNRLRATLEGWNILDFMTRELMK